MLDVWEVLVAAGEQHGSRLAVVDAPPESDHHVGSGQLTYAQLHSRCCSLAEALHQTYKVTRGQSVGVLIRNSSAVVELHFALAALHAVLVNFNTSWAPPEVHNC